MTSRILRWVIGLVILALILLRLSFFIVREGELAVVERFGNVRAEITQPGRHWKWFWPIEREHRFDARKRVFSPTFAEALTRDNRTIIVYSYVVWSIDRERFLDFVRSFKGTDVGAAGAIKAAEDQLNNAVLAATMSVVGSYGMNELVSLNPQERKLDQMEADVVKLASDVTRNSGIRLHQFGFQRLAFPEKNMKEALVQMRARRETDVNRYKGEGAKVADTIRAATKSEVEKIRAEAERSAAVIRGRGDADAARILQEAYREAPEFYSWLRSLETLKKVLTDRVLLILDTASPPFDALKTPSLVEGPTTRPAPRPPGAAP